MPSLAAEHAANAKLAVSEAVAAWPTDFEHFVQEPVHHEHFLHVPVLFSKPTKAQPVASVQVRVLFSATIPSLQLSYRIENESLWHRDGDKVFFHPTWLTRIAKFKQSVADKFQDIFTSKTEATRLAHGSILDKLGRSAARAINADPDSARTTGSGDSRARSARSILTDTDDGAVASARSGYDIINIGDDMPKRVSRSSVTVTLTPEAALVRDGTHRTSINDKISADKDRKYSEEHAKAIASVREFESELIRRFKGADDDGNGVLDSAEFFEILKACGFGLKDQDVLLLMSEADENSDGQVDYNEFVPIAVELLQVVTNAQFAEYAAAERESQVKDEELRELYSAELSSTLDKVEKKLDAAAPNWREDLRILRTTFRQCLGDRRNGLLREEINMCMGLVVVDPTDNNMVMLTNIADLIVNVRLTTVRTMSQRRTASNLELYLLQQMEDFEKAAKKAPANGVTGMLTPEQLRDVFLFHTPQVIVSRVQALAIVAQAQPDPNTGLVDCRRFANVASFIISEMFDVGTLKEKHELARRADVQPIELMGGRGREQLEKDLVDLFHGYDDDGNGTLDREEFKVCIEALDLNLSPAMMQTLLLAADEDDSGDVDYSEFSGFAYDILLHLVREQALQDLKDDKVVTRLRKFSNDGQVIGNLRGVEEVPAEAPVEEKS